MEYHILFSELKQFSVDQKDRWVNLGEDTAPY